MRRRGMRRSEPMDAALAQLGLDEWVILMNSMRSGTLTVVLGV